MLKEALEEQGIHLFEVDGRGFVQFNLQKSQDDVSCAGILHAWQKPECRDGVNAKALFDAFCESVKTEKDVKVVVWSVPVASVTKESACGVCLALGMKIHTTDKDKIVFTKTLE